MLFYSMVGVRPLDAGDGGILDTGGGFGQTEYTAKFPEKPLTAVLTAPPPKWYQSTTVKVAGVAVLIGGAYLLTRYLRGQRGVSMPLAPSSEV